MARLRAQDPASTNADTQRLLDAVDDAFGLVPNVVRAMTASPVVLQAFIGFQQALGQSALSPALRERIALAVAEANDCDYCVAAHTALAHAAGLSHEDVCDSRRAMAPDRAADAALRFARRLIETRGHVTDDDVTRLRRAGFDDRHIAEIVATAALHVFTNYFALVAQPVSDFDEPAALAPANTEDTPHDAAGE